MEPKSLNRDRETWPTLFADAMLQKLEEARGFGPGVQNSYWQLNDHDVAMVGHLVDLDKSRIDLCFACTRPLDRRGKVWRRGDVATALDEIEDYLENIPRGKVDPLHPAAELAYGLQFPQEAKIRATLVIDAVIEDRALLETHSWFFPEIAGKKVHFEIIDWQRMLEIEMSSRSRAKRHVRPETTIINAAPTVHFAVAALVPSLHENGGETAYELRWLVRNPISVSHDAPDRCLPWVALSPSNDAGEPDIQAVATSLLGFAVSAPELLKVRFLSGSWRVDYLTVAPYRLDWGSLGPDFELVDAEQPPANLCPEDRTTLTTALQKLRIASAFSGLPGQLLRPEFSLRELEAAYEACLGSRQQSLDTSSFRRKVKDAGLVQPTEGFTQPATGRRSQLYTLSEAYKAGRMLDRSMAPLDDLNLSGTDVSAPVQASLEGHASEPSGSKATMRDILNDAARFTERFCSTPTIRNLAEIDPDDLRQVLLRLHSVIPFEAAATPELWTPEPSPQPVVVIGWMSWNGKLIMNAPRFGLCTDAPTLATSGATGLYLWVDHRMLNQIDPSVCGFGGEGAPFNWRSGENGLPDPTQRFYRFPEALYSKIGGHRDLEDFSGSSDQAINLVGLLSALGKLMRAPSKKAVDYIDPRAHEFGFPPGCYTPAAISAVNASIRRK
jgi:hypothetical protein